MKNKLLQHLINSGDVSHKILPQFQSRGEVPSWAKPIPISRGDLQSGMSKPAMLKTQKEAERMALINKAFNNGEIRKGTNQSKISKAVSIMANPMTAASYVVKGQRIPDNFEKGQTNNYDLATAIVNPFGVAQDIRDTNNEFSQGNYGRSAMSAMGFLPLPQFGRITRDNLQGFLGKAVNNGNKFVRGMNNEGVFLLNGNNDYVVKLEKYKNQLNDDISNYNMVERMRNISDDAPIAKVYHQIDDVDLQRISNEPLRASIMKRLHGLNNEQMGPLEYANMPKEAIAGFYDHVKKLRNEDLAFDFAGNNYLYDPNSKQISLFDIAPQPKILDPQLNAIYGNSSLKHFGTEKSAEHIKRRMLDKFSNDYANSLLPMYNDFYDGNSTYTLEQLNAIKDRGRQHVGSRVYNTLKDLDPFTKGGAIHNSQFKQVGPILDPRGQWAHPGKVTRIPSDKITMQRVPYPVYGVGSNGKSQMMYPEQEYDFGGAAYVDEFPMMQGGGPIDNTSVRKPYVMNAIGFVTDDDVKKYNKLRNDKVWGDPYKFMMNWYSDPVTKSRLQKQGAPQNPMTGALNQKLYTNYLQWYIDQQTKNRKKAESIHPNDYSRSNDLARILDKELDSEYNRLNNNTSGFHTPFDSTVAINNGADQDASNSMKETAVHELTHATPLDNFYTDYFKKNKPKSPDVYESRYFSENPSEIYPRIQDLRYQMWRDRKIAPGTKVTPSLLDGYKNDSRYDLRNYYSPEELSKIMNEIAFGKSGNTTGNYNMKEGKEMIRKGGQIMQVGGFSMFPISPINIINKVTGLFNPAPQPKKEEEVVSGQPKVIQVNATPLEQMDNLHHERYSEFWNKWYDRNMIDDSKQTGKPISLTAGRFRGATVNPSMINNLVNAAKEQNIDPWLMVSLAGRESTFGSGTSSNRSRANDQQDIVSGWNIAEKYQPYNSLRFLADKKVPGISYRKNNHGWFYEPEDPKAINNYLTAHPEIMEAYRNKLDSTPDMGNRTAFQLAAEHIKQKGIKNYNPGDPNYERMFLDDMAKLKSDKEMAAYMKSLGYRMGGQLNRGLQFAQQGGPAYVVKQGDTLNKIAAANNVTLRSIINANNISNPDLISIGQKLVIPVVNQAPKQEYQDWSAIKSRMDQLNSMSDEDKIVNYYASLPDAPYIVVDKKNARMKVYQGNKKIKDYEVGTGAVPGDAQTVTRVVNGKTDWEGGNRSTGAGVYTISNIDPKSKEYYDLPAFNLKNDQGIEVATTIHGTPMARRSRFDNKNISDNRMSNGCINGKCFDLQDLYKTVDVGTPVYILPEDAGNRFQIVDGKPVLKVNAKDKAKYNQYVDKRGQVRKGQGINQSVNTLSYKPIQPVFDEKTFKENVYQWNDFNDEDEYRNTTVPFYNSLVNNKEKIMKASQIPSDVYNELARMAFGIYGTESNYGDTHSAIGNFGRALNKFRDEKSNSSPDYMSKATTYRANKDNNSVGLTQIRWTELNDDEKNVLKKLGITSNKDFINPEKAAIATTAILGVRYNQQLTQDQKKDVWSHLPSKWNVRPNYGSRVKSNAAYLNFRQLDRKYANGGEQDREMLEGVADMLRRVRDQKNRREIAQYMMNNFRQEKVQFKPSQFLEESNVYANGGEMIRRADGSYSRRGMWDNLRDNIGSGRKPTPEMIKQENKIKKFKS